MSWPPKEIMISLNTMSELKMSLKASLALQNDIEDIRVFKFQVSNLVQRHSSIFEIIILISCLIVQDSKQWWSELKPKLNNQKSKLISPNAPIRGVIFLFLRLIFVYMI